MNHPDASVPQSSAPSAIPDWSQAQAAWSLFGSGLEAALGFFTRDCICRFATPSYSAVYATDAEAESLLGSSFAKIVGPHTWASVEPEVQRALGGTACVYERRLDAPQGERWIEVRLLPYRVNTRLIGFWAVVFDVHERSMQERLLEAAWHRLEQFSQAATEGIAFYENGVMIDCNEALSRLLGRPREHLIGLPVVSLFPERDREIALRHIHLGREVPYPASLTRPDGSTVDVEIIGRQANWRSADLYVATVRDVSKLNRVSESLLRSQARYRVLVEHAVEAILFAQKGRVVYANPAACKLYGLSSEALVGEHVLRLAHPDERERMKLSPAFRGVQDDYVEVKVLCPPAPLTPLASDWSAPPEAITKCVRISGVGVEWEGAPAAMIFITDITAEHEAKEQLLRALQQERELGQLRTRFVSMASHEFRTPLATIQTSTELLQHYHARLSAEQREEAVADILQSVQRMQGMIDNFLMLGRMQADAMKCEPRRIGLVEVLQHIASECAIADDHQHLVMLDVEPGIGMTQQLLLDEMLLRLIAGNLLGNACKYSAAGSSVTLRVQRHTELEREWLCIAVSDHGIGIPQADLPRLFEAFHRASNTGEVRGTGVGLAIVQRAVQSHGGSIEVHTEQGVGSTFSVRLPWVDLPKPHDAETEMLSQK